jgi:hypothetical protein
MGLAEQFPAIATATPVHRTGMHTQQTRAVQIPDWFQLWNASSQLEISG